MAEIEGEGDGRRVDATPVIRDGRPSDVPAVHAAILKLADETGASGYVTSTPDDLLRGFFGAKPFAFMTIAEMGPTFAGMCLHFPIFSTWMGGPGVYVQDLYIEAAFRRLKIGDALLRHVAKQSRDAGGIYLRLSVDIDNVKAQRFYEKLGIRRSEYEQVHRVSGPAFAAFCDGENVHDAIETGE